jgi:elongator complex protein 3
LMSTLQTLVPEYVRLNRTYRDIPASEILAWSKLANLRQIVENRLKEKWIKLLDIRNREIKFWWNDPTKAVLRVFEYEASWWMEYFLTFEDQNDRTIFSLLRLRLPMKKLKVESWKLKDNVLNSSIWELQNCAIIRQLHTFWDQLSIWEKWNNSWQHIWFWKRLILEAENIAKNNNYKKIAIISWVGVREYYAKRWYILEWEYMVKEL